MQNERKLHHGKQDDKITLIALFRLIINSPTLRCISSSPSGSEFNIATSPTTTLRVLHVEENLAR